MEVVHKGHGRVCKWHSRSVEGQVMGTEGVWIWLANISGCIYGIVRLYIRNSDFTTAICRLDLIEVGWVPGVHVRSTKEVQKDTWGTWKGADVCMIIPPTCLLSTSQQVKPLHFLIFHIFNLIELVSLNIVENCCGSHQKVIWGFMRSANKCNAVCDKVIPWLTFSST